MGHRRSLAGPKMDGHAMIDIDLAKTLAAQLSVKLATALSKEHTDAFGGWKIAPLMKEDMSFTNVSSDLMHLYTRLLSKSMFKYILETNLPLPAQQSLWEHLGLTIAWEQVLRDTHCGAINKSGAEVRERFHKINKELVRLKTTNPRDEQKIQTLANEEVLLRKSWVLTEEELEKVLASHLDAVHRTIQMMSQDMDGLINARSTSASNDQSNTNDVAVEDPLMPNTQTAVRPLVKHR